MNPSAHSASSALSAPAATSAPSATGRLEKTHLRIGFVSLSDMAPLAAAKLLEFGHAHGLTFELCKQPSWAAVRDKLLSGDLDAAHALYGLVYGVQLGLGGPQTEMAVLMVLNRNGQAVTLSTRLADALAEHRTLPAALATLGRKPVFAQTFPTGTHAMWLYYWLASQKVHPLRDIESVAIPPPQMVAALEEDRLDGLCVGDPWNALAEARGVGRTIAYSSEIWPDHPDKVLACRRDFVDAHPNTAQALIQTMLEACRWLDGAGHRAEIAGWLARPELIGIDAASIAARLSGEIDPRAPQRLPMRFFDNGAVNYPRALEGEWFLSQFRRWGMLDHRGNDRGNDGGDDRLLAAQINQTALYRRAAANIGVTVPDDATTCAFIDGRIWDGSMSAADYAASFDIRA